MILIYRLKSLTDEYSVILATWPFGEAPSPSRGLLADPLPSLLATWFLEAHYAVNLNTAAFQLNKMIYFVQNLLLYACKTAKMPKNYHFKI